MPLKNSVRYSLLIVTVDYCVLDSKDSIFSIEISLTVSQKWTKFSIVTEDWCYPEIPSAHCPQVEISTGLKSPISKTGVGHKTGLLGNYRRF